MFLLSRLAGDLPKAEPSKSSDHTLVLEGEPSQPQWGKVEKGCHRQRMFGLGSHDRVDDLYKVA